MEKIQNMSVNIIDSKSVVGIITEGNVQIEHLHLHPPKEENFIKDFKIPRLNEPFKGRDEELKELNSLYFTQNIKKVVIAGIPGYGKTELSKQFAHQCKKDKLVDEVVWVKAEGKRNKKALEELSDKLDNIYEEYKECKVLFIFDNGENRKAIKNLEPPKGEEIYYLLITSREKDWYDDIQTFEIQSLAVEASIEIYAEIIKEENKPMHEELSDVVNNVPLAVQVTAAFIRQQKKRRGQHFELKNYVDELKERKLKFLDLKITNCMPNDYEKTLYGAISMSIEQILNEENEDVEIRDLAKSALFVCAYLDADDITFKDLLQICSIRNVIEGYDKDDDILMDSLSWIDNFYLITYDSNELTISMHRSIQDILRYHLDQRLSELKSEYYTSCLQFHISILFKGRHEIIWKYADDDVVLFYNIYSKLIKNFKASDTYFRILELLIDADCTKSLNKIFENDWDKDELNSYIIENELIYVAAMADSVNVMEMLIKTYNIDINVRGTVLFKNITLLHAAALLGALEVIKFLIINNADLDALDKENNTALFNLFERILKYRDKKPNQWNEIMNLLKFDEIKNKTNHLGETLIHMAAKLHVDKSLIECLVKIYHMDVNAKTNSGFTPLHTAICKCQRYSKYLGIELVRTLKECGARLEITDNQGKTPLHYAQEKNIDYLIEYLTEEEEPEVPAKKIKLQNEMELS